LRAAANPARDSTDRAAHASQSPAAVMARADTENFPVAPRLLPRRYRSHLLAIYGFARLADTIGDESEGAGWPSSTGSRRSWNERRPERRPTPSCVG